jgi:hypothetical protein
VSLASLIRGKSESRHVAIDTPAIPDTDNRNGGPTVSRIATVSVAKPENPKTKATPGTSRRDPTDAKTAELKALIRACGEPYAFTEADYAEALQRALADVDAALVCYRHMARIERVDVAALLVDAEPDDDRRRCTECANLLPGDVCAVARRYWEAGPCVPARRPVPGLLRRCDGFVSKGAA